MRMASIDSYVWNYLGRIRKCGLIQRDVSLGVSFEFSETHTRPSCSLFAVKTSGSDVNLNTQLLLQHHARLP